MVVDCSFEMFSKVDEVFGRRGESHPFAGGLVSEVLFYQTINFNLIGMVDKGGVNVC